MICAIEQQDPRPPTASFYDLDMSDYGHWDHDSDVNDDDVDGGVSLDINNTSSSGSPASLNDIPYGWPMPPSPEQAPASLPDESGLDADPAFPPPAAEANIIQPADPFQYLEEAPDVLPPGDPFLAEVENPEVDAFLADAAPIEVSNPNPAILGSGNLSLESFLRHWATDFYHASSSRLLQPRLIDVMAHCRATGGQVNYSDLQGDLCDLQGLDWTKIGPTRADARSRRRHNHSNHTNRRGSDRFMPALGDQTISARDSFFRFKRMTMRLDAKLAHFQLRSVLACPTRLQAYYPGSLGVNRVDLVSGKADVGMKLAEFAGMASPITTLDVSHGVLICGTFRGEYFLKPLNSQGNTPSAEGSITHNPNGITNHMKIHSPRLSGQPVAAIASNDAGFRVMDIETQRFVSDFQYDFALNCSAISPDRRLRVMVGDCLSVLITDAESGQILRKLNGPRDYGFACDWSDDGWTIATAAQDRCIKVWDARRLCNSNGQSTPIRSIRTEMGAARSLHFSPAGSGPPVLVAVEEADIINIIDADCFKSKQVVEIFGEMGGAAFTNGGQDLNVLCGDESRGGVLQFERCGHNFGLQTASIYNNSQPSTPFGWLQGTGGTQWGGNHRSPARGAPKQATMRNSMPLF